MACCGGCGANDIFLTGKALELLAALGKYAFLPLGERNGKPVYISESGETFSNAVTALSLSGLITTDYDIPMKGFDYKDYVNCSRLGSMALTARGQAALESIDTLGVEP